MQKEKRFLHYLPTINEHHNWIEFDFTWFFSLQKRWQGVVWSASNRAPFSPFPFSVEIVRSGYEYLRRIDLQKNRSYVSPLQLIAVTGLGVKIYKTFFGQRVVLRVSLAPLVMWSGSNKLVQR
jgi:hypothetical protein